MVLEGLEAVLAEASPSQRLLSWNTFLAAELSAKKGRVIRKELDPLFVDWASQLANHPELTEKERERVTGLVNPNSIPEDLGILEESEFPPTLLDASGFSCGLMFRGDVSVINRPCIAIVGTRNASTYGKVCAKKFAEEFAKAGVTVVSGGAIGIDGISHESAIQSGGKTVAVLANGLDVNYPSSHAGLFTRISQQGCLLSQFALGSKPADFKFIQRNVIIAALAMAVVVIEAPLKSGSIRTAGFAAEFGREVFVIPGMIDAFGFQGSHALIRDGATLVDHPWQVLESLGITPHKETVVKNFENPVLAQLDSHPKTVEKIVELTGMTASDVLSELTMLELDGLAIRDSGGYAKTL